MPLAISPLFSDHAVLHRSSAVPIWGRAEAGATVRVCFDNQNYETTVSPSGRWEVTLDTSACGDGPFDLLVESGTTLRCRDILVGEVWLCSGQSNMEFRLVKEASAATVIPATRLPQVRHFKVKNAVSPTPSLELEGEWVVADPEHVGNFTSVGFYFARRLHASLKGPVGLINSSWGNTPSESWTSAEALDRDPELKAARLRDDATPVQRDEPQVEGCGAYPGDTRLPKQRAAVLFNAMIAPLIPCAIRGVLWYQGESNAARAVQYRTAFPLLINDWRARWGRGDFPFYFCQISAFKEPALEPGESSWAELREAQSRTLALPNTAMVVLIDTGESADIHPRNKRTVGERLAQVALANLYGAPLPVSGPLYRSYTVEEGGRIRLYFDHATGLCAAPLPESYAIETLTNRTGELPTPLPESPLQGFAICGADRKWHWAHAIVEGESVVVQAPQRDAPAPIAVRYGWADYPICNLTNSSGLPASPFRTDDFPELTRDERY